jgi:hypothetical protein
VQVCVFNQRLDIVKRYATVDDWAREQEIRNSAVEDEDLEVPAVETEDDEDPF